jgi:hypothetical protein
VHPDKDFPDFVSAEGVEGHVGILPGRVRDLPSSPTIQSLTTRFVSSVVAESQILATGVPVISVTFCSGAVV